jgi:hypothetical protein
MNNIKKIGLLTLLCMFTSIYSLSELNDRFKPEQTNEFSYTITKTNRPIKTYEIQLDEVIIISDTIKNNLLNTGFTRIKITETRKNHKVTTSIEKWTTKSPSYLTWTNAALIGALIATGALSNYMYEMDIKHRNEFLNLPKTNEPRDKRYFNGKEPQAIRNDEKHAINLAIKQGFISEKNAEILWDNEVKRANFLNRLRDENRTGLPYQKGSLFDRKWYKNTWNQYYEKAVENPVEELEFNFTDK